MKKNKVLKSIGTTMLAGSLLFGGFTNVGIQAPEKVEAASYEQVNLKQGMRHKDVIQLKKDLAKAGFIVAGKGTNLFGKQTEKQVKAFQRYYGLSADGVVGNQMKSTLNTVTNSPLQSGQRHKDTVQLKNDLARAGFKVPGKGTNLYGKQTEKQVKAFQKKYKLIQNGIADSVTLKKIDAVVNPTLENGVRHQSVKQLKRDLAKAGFKVPGKGTNFFGKGTEKQVKAFQKYYGLSQSGKIDNNTDKQIKELVKTALQNGKRHKETVQLKKDLAIVGFKVPGNNTTLYGKQTEKQVKAFQRKYKLVQNGIADKVTLNKLASVVNEATQPKELANGVRDQKVVQLKRDLEKAGFKVAGKGTNLFGKQTEVQVKAFQKYYGLSQSGKVDNNTDKKIKEVVNSPLQSGKRHKDTVQLKKNLAKVGFSVAGKGTNLYGKATEKQVKAFQKKHNLVQNGIADTKTLSKLQIEVQIKNEIKVKVETEKESIDYKTIYEDDPTLLEGESKVTSAGVNGEKTLTYEITYVNGKESDRKLTNEQVTIKPVDKVVKRGTLKLSDKEKATLDLINEYRVEQGVSPLQFDNRAAVYARDWSQHLSKTGKWEHSNLQNILQAHDDIYSAGENLIKGTSSNEVAVQGWKDSPGHNKNMLATHYTHFGLGYEPKGDYWTLILIRVQN